MKINFGRGRMVREKKETSYTGCPHINKGFQLIRSIVYYRDLFMDHITQ